MSGAGDADGGGTSSRHMTVEEASAAVTEASGRPPGPRLTPPMEKPPGIGTSGFFDPETPGRPYRIALTRLVEDGREAYRLEHPLGYWDAEVGGVIVPADLAQFRTDLLSVPRLFAWLIPPTGLHLPAALIHDGLVHRPEEPQSYIAATPIDRVTADRIFRTAMRDLGTSWLRRWLMWTAVAVATMVAGPFARTWRGRLAVGLTMAVVAVGGTLATIDLFDCRELLPWMGDRPLWVELASGAVGAVVVPALLALLWGRQWRAGIIAGAALALLVHVTVALALVYALFSAADAAIERELAAAVRWTAAAVGIAGAVTVIGVVAC